MGFHETVVEGNSWVGNSVEHLVCIVCVGDFQFQQSGEEIFGEIWSGIVNVGDPQ